MAEQALTQQDSGILARRYQLLALGGLIVLFLLPSDGLGLILCPLKNLSGLDCPACGLTRSLSSFLHLEFGRSFAYHPLGVFVLAGFLLALFPRMERANATGRFSDLYRYRWQIVVTLFVVVWALRLFTGALSN